VMAPKIILDLSGQLIRPVFFYNWLSAYGFTDIHSALIIPLFSMVLIPVLVIAYRKGKLNPRRPIALLIIIYLLVVAVTPFVQPRYNYFVYVLLALELAKKEEPEEELEFKEAAAPSPGWLAPGHAEGTGSY